MKKRFYGNALCVAALAYLGISAALENNSYTMDYGKKEILLIRMLNRKLRYFSNGYFHLNF